MTIITQDFRNQSRDVFASHAGMSLQDLRDRIAVLESGSVRRDMLSALDSLARLFNRPLIQIPANPKQVRLLLASKSAAQLRLSDKRYANIRSCLAAAIRDHADTPQPITKRIPLKPDWEELLAAIARPKYRMALYRLAAFCSYMNIAPGAVTATTLLGFHDALEVEDVVKNPRRVLKHTMAHWNMCRRQVATWPDIALSSPFKIAAIALPLTAFPESFQQDVHRWTQRLSNPDPFDPDAPARALRPATMVGYVDTVLRFASVLVQRGALPLDGVTGLSVLVQIDHFKRGLRFFLDRFDGKVTPYIGKIANALLAIARHCCKTDAATLQQLALICRRLDSRGPRQMTAKNRERLRQFDDPTNVARLLAFPQEERARGLAQQNPLRAAKCFERALAVALLIHCTLRISNLRAINMATDLSWAGGKCHLSIAREHVKNDQALEFELPSEVADLLQEYLRDYRPRFPGSDGPYLFPGRNGGPRPHGTMREDFISAMRNRAGLVMNPHLARHAIAKIVVERDPGLYMVISRQLGHKRIDMTMAHYLGTETRAAGRHINKLLSAALANPTIPEE